MGSRYSGSSSTLPGAWSSSWTLSEGAHVRTEQPPNLPKGVRENNPSQAEENQNLAFHGIHNPKERVVLHSVDTNICGDADWDSSLSDEESGLSDDFYSFISQEDSDSTLSPSVETTPRKHSNGVEEILRPNLPAESEFVLTGLNSNLHLSTQQDVTLPNNVLATVSVPLSPHSSKPSSKTAVTSSSTMIQHDSSSSQGDPVTDTDGHSERASIHSSYSGSNHSDAYHLIDRVNSGITPQDSSDDSNALVFPQPDGNSPWTLSLEPTLSFTESGHSTASLSVESSSASDGGFPFEICQQPEPAPFEFHSPSLDHPPIVNDESKTLYHRRSTARPSVEASTPEQGSTNPESSHLTIGDRNASIRSRSVIQKTKEFCKKFKRFLTSTSSKSKRENNSLLAPGAYTLVDVDTQLAQGYSFPLPASPRRGGFMRRAKASSPSVALSEYPSYQAGSVVDDIHSYDYHARPKTLQEIKSRRRFSLPAFSGASPASARAKRKAGHMG